MTDDHLRDALAALKAEVEAGSATDPGHRARMEALCAQLELELDQDTDAERTRAFAETVQDAIRRYEVEHPQLTAVLSRILRTLESMGI